MSPLCQVLVLCATNLVQGVSQAGNQAAENDPRTSLVKHVFKHFDALEDGCQTQLSLPRMAPSLFEFCGFVFQSPGMRRAIFLENVAALRSKPLKSLWQWLLQVPVLGHEFAMAAGGCPY